MLEFQKLINGRSLAQAVVLGLFASSTATPVPSTNASQSDVCLTPGCITAAARILSNLHPQRESIDPCENFDQYVCGGYPLQHPNEDVYSTLDEIQDSNWYILQEILQNPYPNRDNKSDPKDKAIFDMMVKNYISCKDNATIESAAPTELETMIEMITKLFPIKDYSSNETLQQSDHQALADTIEYLTKNGVPLFGEFWTSPDWQNPDKTVPSFGFNKAADRTLPVPNFVIETAQLNETVIVETLELILPINATQEATTRLAQSLLEFTGSWSLLLQSLPPDAALVLNLTLGTTTVEEASKIAPNLVFDKVISALAPSNYTADRMVFEFMDLYAELSRVISKTPRSTIQIFMFLSAYNSLAKYIAGSSALYPDRDEFCIKYVDQSLPWIASKFFVEEAYSAEERNRTTAMAGELQMAFIDRIKTRDWLTESTKKLIEEKASEIIVSIGVPDNDPDVLSSSDLANYYSGINITDSLASNVISIRQWAVRTAFQQLDQAVDRTAWPLLGVTAYTANARYDTFRNKIMIPAGISQPPLLFPGTPNYLAYGSLGLISGHEITHGFDSNGRLFDNDRRAKNWWDSASVSQFTNRTRCFVEQYSNMQAVDHNGKPFLNATNNQPLYVDGNLTLAENIADTGGVGNAFDAWKMHEQSNPSQALPGLESFTKEQMFFVGAGQAWCSKFTAQAMANQITTDVHSPPFARIRGFTQNSQGFREAFQCKEKKPTCELW